MSKPGRASVWAAVEPDEARGIVLMVTFTVVTVLAADTTAGQISAGVLMALAEAGLLLSRHSTGHARAAGVGLAVLAGLAAIAVAPAGAAEVPVLVAAARLPLVVGRRHRTIAITLVAIAFGATLAAVTGAPGTLLAAAGVPLLAQRTSQQQELTAERDRAVTLLREVEASRDAQAASAATEERARIAREMHDVLAHSLSGLSLQLQAARAVAVKEGASQAITDPLQKAADLAREGIAEARAAVGVLAATPTRGIAALPALLEGTATLQVEGRPHPLGAEADHAVYRAVQECLTNAARHATGASVSVAMTWSADRLELTVTNGAPSGPLLTGTGNGFGLDGMRARLLAVGGTVTAGPDGGGWRVHLCVPGLP